MSQVCYLENCWPKQISFSIFNRNVFKNLLWISLCCDRWVGHFTLGTVLWPSAPVELTFQWHGVLYGGLKRQHTIRHSQAATASRGHVPADFKHTPNLISWCGGQVRNNNCPISNKCSFRTIFKWRPQIKYVIVIQSWTYKDMDHWGQVWSSLASAGAPTKAGANTLLGHHCHLAF